MISFPSRTQLRCNNGQYRSPQDDSETSGTIQSPLPSSQIFYCLSDTAAIPRSSEPVSLSVPISMNDPALSGTPSLYSNDSPLSGSTLCPTPQSARLQDGNGDPTSSVDKNPESITSFAQLLDPASYTVETLDSQDDAHRIAPWKRRVYRLSPFTTLISMVAYFTYYAYRIHCTLDAQRAFNQVYIMAWIFICAEGCAACG